MSDKLIWDLQLRKRLRQGASGAGKTQTLKMVAGIVAPDGGRVAVAGRVLFDSGRGLNISAQQRHLAYMFQDYALFPHLTVRQNVAFALRHGLRNPGHDEAHEDVERWLKSFGLNAVAAHHPHQISGGQRQRTALARALVSRPTALLLDEPFAALDRGLRQRLREELKQLQTELQLPLLFITHDEEDVQCLAQDLIRLEAGHVQ
jgi:molybdate transport system ATP-binding protein